LRAPSGFIPDVIAKSGLSLSHAEHEDALAHLLGEAFQLAERAMTRAEKASPTMRPGGSEQGSSTGRDNGSAGRNGNSTTESTSASVLSLSASTTMSLVPNWQGLSAEGAWATVNIGWPLSSGASMKELSAQLGESQKWLEAQLERLQRELVRLSLVTTDVEG
jgi:hypothetical protein